MGAIRWLFLGLLAYGFYQNRHFLKRWGKDWWEQMKLVWNAGDKKCEKKIQKKEKS